MFPLFCCVLRVSIIDLNEQRIKTMDEHNLYSSSGKVQKKPCRAAIGHARGDAYDITKDHKWLFD